jgi:hypothetical protein
MPATESVTVNADTWRSFVANSHCFHPHESNPYENKKYTARCRQP